MKIASRLLSTLSILMALTSCKSFPQGIERCIVGDAGGICADPDVKGPDGKPEAYVRDPEAFKNYICTNPDDYQRINVWMAKKCK
jgi:hypothetical protein